MIQLTEKSVENSELILNNVFIFKRLLIFGTNEEYTKPHQRSITRVEESSGNFKAEECDSGVFKELDRLHSRTNETGGWAKGCTERRRGNTDASLTRDRENGAILSLSLTVRWWKRAVEVHGSGNMGHPPRCFWASKNVSTPLSIHILTTRVCDPTVAMYHLQVGRQHCSWWHCCQLRKKGKIWYLSVGCLLN